MEYERFIGRRDRKQRSGGDYSASASRTFASAGLDSALTAWREAVERAERSGGIVPDGLPQVSVSDAWRYWRAALADGSRVTVSISMKTQDKANVAVSHDRLPDREAVERWKAYWKGLLGTLGS